jgi:D-alanine transaminase
MRDIAAEELLGAQEVWLSAATRDVIPVTMIDGRPVGNGAPGPRWVQMNEAIARSRAALGSLPAYS